MLQAELIFYVKYNNPRICNLKFQFFTEQRNSQMPLMLFFTKLSCLTGIYLNRDRQNLFWVALLSFRHYTKGENDQSSFIC